MDECFFFSRIIVEIFKNLPGTPTCSWVLISVACVDTAFPLQLAGFLMFEAHRYYTSVDKRIFLQTCR